MTNTNTTSVAEIALIEKAAIRVGMKSMLNMGAASCVYSEGCEGVTQDHLIAFAREVAVHCVAALAAQPLGAQEPAAWRHSRTLCPYATQEEVPLADGDEWAEPLYTHPAPQAAQAVPDEIAETMRRALVHFSDCEYEMLKASKRLVVKQTAQQNMNDADAALNWLAAAPSAPAQPQEAQAVPQDVENLAVNRYRTAPGDSPLTRPWLYKVVAGDGSRALYTGTKDGCATVARKLTEAFLDGAHAMLAAAHGIKGDTE